MIEASPRDIAVAMTGITKRFGAVLANAEVDLTVDAGTVHGLVGENGAGKSTLMSVLYGFYTADQGRIEVFGQPATVRNSHEAIRLGLGMVHQHFMLVDTLTALENVMLGAEPHALLRRAEREVRGRLETLMASTGLKVALDALVGDLSVGDRQRLEILKTLYRGAKILILDEPTAVLTPQETEQLFEVLARLRSQGTTIILITHKLGEVIRLCDRVTVMRAGRVVGAWPIAETTTASLAEAMVGRKVATGRPVGVVATAPGAVVLHAEGLVVRDALGVTRLSGVGLTLRAGEIVGVAGVAGNGQSELLDVLSGLTEPVEGRLTLGGGASEERRSQGLAPEGSGPDGSPREGLALKERTSQGSAPSDQPTTFAPRRWLDPRTARRLGLAHVPEDRHARAMVMGFAAWESAVLGYEGLADYSRRGWMLHRRMRAATAAMMERFDVRPRDPALVSSKFSGGNQQKLVLAREIGQAPRVLLIGQPTRGVDIGAIEFIHGQLRRLRDAGCALLVVSSELEEILALADRVVVMNEGRITGELSIADCSERRLGLLMTETRATATPREAVA